MNYRHAYHAGNHADVLKHAVLARVIEAMKRKDKPFRMIDAHAGVGLYDLSGIEAGKTGEWEGGVGRLAEPFAAEVEALLAPYRAVIAALNPHGALTLYPGSPELALRLMRGEDRMIANELHPEDAIALERHFIRDARVDVTSMDAETCLKAKLPPAERRGVILIDPPYEVKTEAEKAVRMLAHGLRRFAQGVYLLWYPLKADDTAETYRCGGDGAWGSGNAEGRVARARGLLRRRACGIGTGDRQCALETGRGTERDRACTGCAVGDGIVGAGNCRVVAAAGVSAARSLHHRRHPGEGRGPALVQCTRQESWIPACAGMTAEDGWQPQFALAMASDRSLYSSQVVPQLFSMAESSFIARSTRPAAM